MGLHNFLLLSLSLIAISTKNNCNVLIVYYNDPMDVALTVANEIGSGASSSGATSKVLEVSQANYKRDVVEWADVVVIGSGVYNGNAHPDILAFINSFDFMDDLSAKVGGSFATGAAVAAGLQPVLEQINRGLSIFRMVIAGGLDWKNGEGTGIITDSSNVVSDADLDLARGEGRRLAQIAAALKIANVDPSNSTSDAPPTWGSTWYATVQANLTQVGYDAGLVIVNFTAECGDDPAKQKMRTVYGDFYTVLTRCDLGIEFTIAPASRGGSCTSRKIGQDVDKRICEACGCPFCVRDTNGTFSHGEESGSITGWQSKEKKIIEGVEVTVWTGRAQSTAAAGQKSFDLETTIAYSRDGTTPLFVNVSHPLWVQTAARIDGFTNDIDKSHFDIPQGCFKF